MSADPTIHFIPITKGLQMYRWMVKLMVTDIDLERGAFSAPHMLLLSPVLACSERTHGAPRGRKG
jgi:hypothetical protein